MSKQTEHRVNNQSFDEWKREVNTWIGEQIGLSADDLPDYAFYNAYCDKVDPEEAATDCLDAAGYY